MIRNRWLQLCLLLVALLGAGCAPATQQSGDPDELGDDGVQIRVENNTIPPTSLTISIQPEIGTRRLLGSMTPSSTRTFEYEAGVAAGEYVLLGETVSGQTLRSRPFLLSGDARVTWDVNLNVVRVTERD